MRVVGSGELTSLQTPPDTAFRSKMCDLRPNLLNLHRTSAQRPLRNRSNGSYACQAHTHLLKVHMLPKPHPIKMTSYSGTDGVVMVVPLAVLSQRGLYVNR